MKLLQVGPFWGALRQGDFGRIGSKLGPMLFPTCARAVDVGGPDDAKSALSVGPQPAGQGGRRVARGPPEAAGQRATGVSWPTADAGLDRQFRAPWAAPAPDADEPARPSSRRSSQSPRPPVRSPRRPRSTAAPSPRPLPS